ncbi:MAG TPA: hypothetical protein VLW50_24465 [Streptosporangiaceae bacterium]|nr:hypothetical protein [Streptosporangiaceae bacterium]
MAAAAGCCAACDGQHAVSAGTASSAAKAGAGARDERERASPWGELA